MDALPSIEAIVLAGGQSSRMGRDKALILVGGMPLLQRTCTLGRDLATTVYVVTAWPERYELIVPKDCPIIREPLPTRGPLRAFTLALAEVKTDWVLLLACDLPLLTTAILQQWSRILPTVAEHSIALVPYHDRRWHPLCGFYRRRCGEDLQEFIDRGGKSFQQWLNRADVQPLPIDNPAVLFNCNTPEDLEIIINAPKGCPNEKQHEREEK